MKRIVFDMPVGRSKKILVYLLVIHCLFLASLLSLLHLGYLSLLITIIFILSLIYYCRQYQWLKSNKAITRLQRDSDGKWYFGYGDHSISQALKLTSSFVIAFIVIMRFRQGDSWFEKTVFIIDDAVDPQLFRLLRVYCRDPEVYFE